MKPEPGPSQRDTPVGASREIDDLTSEPFPTGVGRSRRRIVVVVVAALLAVGILAVLVVLPRFVGARIEDEIRVRLGDDAGVGAVDVDGGGLTLRDLSFRLPGRGIRVQVERLRVEGSPLRLARRSRGAVEAVKLYGVDARIGLDRFDPLAGTSEAEEVPSVEVAEVQEESEDAGESSTSRATTVAERESVGDRLELALHLLASDAEISLEGGRIVGVENDEETALLDALALSAHRVDDDRLRSTGSGRTERGGQLSWDLELDLRTPTAEGELEIEDLALAALLPFLPELPLYRPAATRLSGRVEVASTPSGEIGAVGTLSVEDLGVASERVAERPITGVDLSLQGRAALDPRSRGVALEETTVQVGRARVGVAGDLAHREEGYLVDVEASLPAIDCQDALDAIPDSVLGELSALRLGGTLGGRLEVHLDEGEPDDTTLSIRVDDQCRFEMLPSMMDADRLRGPFVHTVYGQRDVVARHETGPGSPGWTPVTEISPFLIHAVLAHEDAAFFRHEGFAPWAIETALERNLEQKRFAYGASTVSMQLAKNLFLSRDKTLSRKVREVVLTWWLESELSKQEILELYLNVIEYGPNLFGIRNASRHYFGRTPDELTPAESAFLATLLPAPSVYHQQYVSGELGANTRGQMLSLLEHMLDRERIDQEALEFGRSELESFSFHKEEGWRRRSVIRGSAAPLPFSTPSAPTSGSTLRIIRG